MHYRPSPENDSCRKCIIHDAMTQSHTAQRQSRRVSHSTHNQFHYRHVFLVCFLLAQHHIRQTSLYLVRPLAIIQYAILSLQTPIAIYLNMIVIYSKQNRRELGYLTISLSLQRLLISCLDRHLRDIISASAIRLAVPHGRRQSTC